MLDGCEKPRKRGGYRMCPMHVTRQHLHGTTEPGAKCHAPLAERFDRFVVRLAECWDWTGSKNNHGYGRMGRIYAHRISYERTFGLIPPGMEILHRCDNPPCTNPSHLMIGTHADNMADRANKGRVPLGRIAPSDIEEMRRLKAEGLSGTAISERFGVSRNYVNQLISGRKGVRA